MNKTMKKYLSIAVAVLALAACSKQEAGISPINNDGGVIRFSTNISTYRVKSTDTSLDENDQVGVFAGTPVNGTNVLYTVNASGKLTSADPLKWHATSTSSVAFTAYYPYDAAVSAKSISFAVQTDQSVAGAYQASDLMAANVAAATPGEDVELEFKHQLHKLIVSVTNNTGKTIAGVAISGVKASANVNLETGAVSDLAETAATILPALHSGKYEAVIIPQTAKPSIVVTTSDGSRYVFVIKNDTAFDSGKTSTANITVEGEGDEVEFSFTVTDWGTNTDLVTDDPTVEKKVWSVIGSWDDWGADISMTCTAAGASIGEGTWEADIAYAVGDVFKLRFDGAWDLSAGLKHGETSEQDWTYFGLGEFDDGYLEQNSNINIALPSEAVAGTYHLKFTYPTFRFVITKVE